MIKTYKDVLSPEQCKNIIEQSQKLLVSRVDHEIRICTGTVIAAPMVNNETILAIPDLIKEYANRYFNEHGVANFTMEAVQIIHYPQGEGFFGRHQDGMSRIASAILYLNYVEEGGDTIFYLEDMAYSVKPEPGKLVFFDSNINHEATIPLSGDKHVVVTWFQPA